MARTGNQDRLDEIISAIQEHPEKRAGWIARLLNTDNKTLTRALPQLEDRGELISEDDNGQLTWFGRKQN
jgi:Mn-dependent DtxR family transcriptional regulator